MSVHYIRAGAVGANDGSSWANAWTSLGAATWTRGDTYYIAGGTYNESAFVYIHPATSGTSTVAIKKANASDNSGDPGWSSAYATDVAYINGPSGSIFPVLDFANGYVTIDGVTGSGTSGHGIVIYNQSHTDVVLFEAGSGYSISHCEIKGTSYGGTTDGYSGIQFSGGKNIYVGYCWIHDVSINGLVSFAVVGTSYSDYGFLFENNVLSETGGCTDPGKHGQGMQLGFNSEMAYCIIRNSIIRNAVGSAFIAFLGGGSANHHDFRIYNNIFYITDPVTYDIVSPGVIWSHIDAVKTNISILNNTTYGLTGATISGSVILEHPSPTNTVLDNNIFEGCRLTGHAGLTTESNNGYYNNTGSGIPSGTTNQVNGSSTTFNNAASYDFTLKAGGYAVGAGLDLSATFTTDITGTTRSSPWSLGAYSYGSGVVAPAFSPVAGTYTSSQSVTITSGTAGATIRYTVDGSTPSSSVGTIYSVPVTISTTTTLKAIAYNGVDADSSVTSGLYTINYPVSRGGAGAGQSDTHRANTARVSAEQHRALYNPKPVDRNAQALNWAKSQGHVEKSFQPKRNSVKF